MNVVIFGAGRRGLRLAKHLIQEKKAVTILDTNQARCTSAMSKVDCMAICGSATDIDKLIEAGCGQADAVIALTDNDETNLVSCGIVASQWPKVVTIAAIRSITYVDKQKDTERKILGISHIVNPDEQAAERICGIIESRMFSDVIYFTDAHFILFTRTIPIGSRFDGKSLMELKHEVPGEYLITGIRRDGVSFTPQGNTILRANDEIAIVADDDESAEIFKVFGGAVTTRLRRIILVGGTSISRYILRNLPKRILKNITIIDKDEDVCEELVTEFPQVLVLHGTITDEQLWDEENLKKSDLLISVTENDELNIITASYAKRLGVKRTMALIKTNTNYMSFARHMDIDAPISTTEATVDTLMKYLRGNGIEALHSIFNGELEIYEYVLSSKFRELGKQLKDVKLKNCIIAGVKRSKDDNFIPNGFYTFTEGDTILVTAAHEDYANVMELFGNEL